MKKIINGLRYDTDTATEIGSAWSKGRSRSDFQFWEASLYKTARSGRYFIAGSGGASTRFGQAAGQNSWTGGSDLIPMSRDEALAWAEVHLSVEEIEEHFADKIDEA